MNSSLCFLMSPSGTAITVSAEGNPLRFVTISMPRGVSFRLAWYCETAFMYKRSIGDQAASSVGTLRTPTRIECDGLPVYVALTNVGCVREHAHCSTAYNS